MLTHNIQANNCENVITVNKAVSNERGYVYFDHTGGTAIAKPTNAGIEVDTLDNILRDLDVTPTAIKMDIEGFEGKALKGFSKYDYIKQIIIEIHSKSLQNEISKFLVNQGFSIEYLKENFVPTAIFNVLKHPFSFFKNEKFHNYNLSTRYFKYLLGFSNKRPIEYKTVGADSEIKILYATKL